MAIDPIIRKKANDIRTKVYGVEVREDLASGLETMSGQVVDNSEKQKVLEIKQNSVESQWQQVIDATTDKDLNSAPEIKAARGTHPNLSQRLFATDQQLADDRKKAKVAGIALNDVNDTQKAILTIITDDGFEADTRYLLPIQQELNVPFCTAIITDRLNVEGFTSVDDLRLLEDSGWEILSHTKSHRELATLPKWEQEEELRVSQEILQSHGFKAENIAYPFGSFNNDTLDLTRKYYRSARSTDYGFKGYNMPPIDTYALKTLWCDSRAVIPNDPSGLQVNTFPYYKYYMDKAIEEKGWVTILLHSNMTEADGYGPLVKQIVNYAKGKMDILTVSQALDKFGNIIDTGKKVENRPYEEHFSVGYDGSTTSNELRFKFKDDNAFTSANSIKDFEPFTCTVNRVNTANASTNNMPDKKGGTLYTYKLVDDSSPNQVYNYQLWQTLYDHNIYQRYTDVNGNWLEFFQVNNMLRIGGHSDNFTTATPVADFPHGVSIHNISNAKASEVGAPEGKGGVLTTYNYKSSLGYGFQEYRIYGTNRKYERNATETSGYEPFKKINFTKVIVTPWTKIPANKWISVTVTVSEIGNNSFVNANPVGAIPRDIIFNVIHKKGKLIFNFFNASSIDTAVDIMEWNIQINDY